MKVAAGVKNNPGGPTSQGNRTMGISLPADVYDLLVDVAGRRKKARAERASVSGILLQGVLEMRDRLEAERRA